MRRACDQCQGTDTQRECERGECYAEYCEQQRFHNDRENRRAEEEYWAELERAENEYWQRRAEDEGAA